MKRKINCIILVNILFFKTLVFSQNPFLGETREFNPNPFKDWQSEDLICKVSKLKTVKFLQTEKFGEAVNIGFDSVSVLFNNNGDYISKYEYSIDKQWYLNCKSQGYYDCSTNYNTYEYQSGSNCLKKLSGRKGGSKTYSMDYDCSNELIQSAVYYFDKNAEKKYVYQYDVNGNNTRVEVYKIAGYSKNETVETICIYEYNANKQIIESKKYNGEGKLTDSYKYRYDLKGNLIFREKYQQSSFSSKLELKEQTTYTYDSKNNILSENGNSNISYPDSKPYSKLYIYVYNPNGTIKQVTKNVGSFTEYIIKYISYDTKGNWIEKLDVKSSIKYKRLIEY